MENNVVARGRTVQEAVTIALDLLGALQDEVDIEVLENEKKGIMGIGAKPAVVRVSLKDRAPTQLGTSTGQQAKTGAAHDSGAGSAAAASPSSDPASAPFEDEIAGKAWVRDGSIFCKDVPEHCPVLSPAEGVLLYKNSILVERPVIVQEQDVLEVRLEEEVRQPEWGITLKDNKMTAELQVTPGYIMRRKLKDKAPAASLQLEIVEIKEPIFIRSGPIMEKLEELGVEYGVDYEEIAGACSAVETGTFIIAKGTPPTEGKHGSFEPRLQLEVRKGLRERSDGTVDYREIQEFPSVEQGQVIGVVLSPVPGYPGTTVDNEPVQPPAVLPLTVKAGKGAALIDDGTRVVATDSGHPELKQRGQMMQISVIPKLVIGQDVSLETGNVRYIGDVEIMGSVQDGMSASAHGNLHIRHNVNMAKINAGCSIQVHNNIITSEVIAGKNSVQKAEITQVLGELIVSMQQMVYAIEQLSAVSAFKVASLTRTGLGPLLKILYESKFKTFPNQVASLLQKIESAGEVVESDLIEFGKSMQLSFLNVQGSSLRTEEDLRQLVVTAEQFYDSTLEVEDEIKHIHAGLVHNSHLYSSGDIMVMGQGVYNSRLHAGRYIEVSGFVRGGELYAAKAIQIGEAGTKGGIVTKLSVPKDGTIRIKEALEDTVIQIGVMTHKFTETTRHVCARIDHAGKIILH